MTILNFIWGFSTGGIGKCFLTYDRLGIIDSNLKIISVCIIHGKGQCDLHPLYDQNIKVIKIKNNLDRSWMEELNEIIRINKIDYFFAHSHNGPIMLSLFSVYYGLKIPFICTCHGFNPRPTVMNYVYCAILLSIWKSKKVRKIICVEKYTPHVLKKWGVPEKKIVTVYNGIESEISTKCITLSDYCKTNNPVVITASRLTKIKGVNYLLKALRIVKDKGISFYYFCIGDGEEDISLKKLCKELGLSDCVIFVGYQNNIPDWMESCDVFALPSLEEFHSIAILEAMRAKKAIVATNIGGNPESLRDEQDALMVPSKDPEALAGALIRLLTSQELRTKLSNSAYERFKKHFTIDVMMRNLAREITATK